MDIASTVSTSEALRTAVTRAVRAPSVHNTQPWRFVIRPDELDVVGDPSRRLAVLDPTGRQWHLSLGCALLNARVSLAAAACPAQVTLLPDSRRPEVMARVKVGADGSIDPVLAALMPFVLSRQTNRRRFSTDSVPSELVDTLIDAASREGARLHAVTQPSDRLSLARLSQRADTQQIADPRYRAELRAWTSTDPDRRDGVPARAVPHIDGTASDDVPLRDFDSQGAGWLPAGTHSSASQNLFVLGTRLDNPSAWVQAGQALERVWLEVARAGYAASLFTQVIELPELRSALARELRLGDHPHVVLRVGHAPMTPSSARRSTADMVEDRSVPALS
jgi:hypothetical protein